MMSKIIFSRFMALCFSSIAFVCLDNAGYAQTQPGFTWLSVHATQPNVKEHTPELTAIVPLDMLNLLLDATPTSFQQKGLAMGFNFQEIVQTVNQSGSFARMSEGTLLAISQTSRPQTGQAQTVVIQFGRSFGMRFSLNTVSRIVQFITSQIHDFRGKEQYIEEIINAARSMPPGIYLVATDGRNQYAIELQ
jgi:hypothetical protein